MRPAKHNFEKWNDECAAKYDLDKFYNHPNRFFRYIENKRIQTLIRFADIKESQRVLDLGCGAGHVLERIKQGYLTGIDVSKTQIERARLRLRPGIELIKAPGEHIPFEDKHFDRILCSEVLEHVLEPEVVLREMNRVLKDDGVISLSIPNENLIILTKRILFSMGLKRILKPTADSWDMAIIDNLEEWHLHKYGLNLVKKQVTEIFFIERIKKIPAFTIPYRYVLKLRKKN